MRKMIFLALGGAAAAYLMKKRGGQAEAPTPAATDYAPAPSGAPAEDVTPDADAETVDAPAADTAAETAVTAESDALRSDQLSGASTGEGVVPDTSADDPVVQEQENAAAAEAGDIGGEADTVTADVEPEMRPVVEGAGDAEETFEQTEEQGR
jgi:hypothetical protein